MGEYFGKGGGQGGELSIDDRCSFYFCSVVGVFLLLGRKAVYNTYRKDMSVFKVKPNME